MQQNCNDMPMQVDQRFFVDLNLGTACNFRCEYCFEQGCYTSMSMRKDVLERFLTLAKIILDNGSHLEICFWGGEPMLYFDTVIKVIDSLYQYDNVSFLLYTNGWFVRKQGQILENIVDKCGWRFTLQISHDFMPNELNHRVMPGKTRAEVEAHVLDAFRWCDEREINFSAKSTSTIDDMEHHLFEQYMTFFEFRNSLRHKENFSLAITPDTSNKKMIDEQALGEQLHKLLVFWAKNKIVHSGFNWFDKPGKMLCSGGARSFTIDVDGTVYPCHRCIYGWGEDHNRFDTGYTSVFDDNALYKIEHNMIAANNLCVANEQCANCETLLCFRCNANNCHGDLNCWNVSNDPAQCQMFLFVSKYIAAYRQMIKNW